MRSTGLIVSALKDMQGVLHMWLVQIFLSATGESLMQMWGVGQGINQHAAPFQGMAA